MEVPRVIGDSGNAMPEAQRGSLVAAGPQKPTLRGLNIQYPFSQPILSGVKLVEARRYPLGYRDIAAAEEELFLIETPGKGSDVALLGDAALYTPPRCAQVVGSVTFSESVQYESVTQ